MKATSVGLLAAFALFASTFAWGQVSRDAPPMPGQAYAGPEKYPGRTTGAPTDVSRINDSSTVLAGQAYVAPNDLAVNQPIPHRDRDDFLRASSQNLTARDLQAIMTQREVLNERGLGPLRDDTGRPVGRVGEGVSAYVPPDDPNIGVAAGAAGTGAAAGGTAGGAAAGGAAAGASGSAAAGATGGTASGATGGTAGAMPGGSAGSAATPAGTRAVGGTAGSVTGGVAGPGAAGGVDAAGNVTGGVGTNGAVTGTVPPTVPNPQGQFVSPTNAPGTAVPPSTPDPNVVGFGAAVGGSVAPPANEIPAPGPPSPGMPGTPGVPATGEQVPNTVTPAAPSTPGTVTPPQNVLPDDRSGTNPPAGTDTPVGFGGAVSPSVSPDATPNPTPGFGVTTPQGNLPDTTTPGVPQGFSPGTGGTSGTTGGTSGSIRQVPGGSTGGTGLTGEGGTAIGEGGTLFGNPQQSIGGQGPNAISPTPGAGDTGAVGGGATGR